MVEITFACGHRLAIRDNQAPVCPCGETKKKAVHTPPPRFRGTVSGPYAKTEALPALGVPFAPKE